MSDPFVRPATPEDAAELAVTMREDDIKELALNGSRPYEALIRGLAFSDSPMTVVGRDGEVIAIYGVVRLAPGVGSPWMLASDGIDSIKRPFIKHGYSLLADIHVKYPLLYNEVWKGNTTHIRWLKRLGFTIVEQELIKPNFYPFWKRNV